MDDAELDDVEGDGEEDNKMGLGRCDERFRCQGPEQEPHAR